MRIAFLCDYFISCFVIVHACTGSVIQQDYESIDGGHDIFWYDNLSSASASSSSTV